MIFGMIFIIIYLFKNVFWLAATKKTEPDSRPDDDEEMPDVFVTRPTVMTEMGPRETKIVTKVKSCESS